MTYSELITSLKSLRRIPFSLLSIYDDGYNNGLNDAIRELCAADGHPAYSGVHCERCGSLSQERLAEVRRSLNA